MSDQTRVEEIFETALPLRGAERSTFLDRACADNATLRINLDGLLRASDRAGAGFLEAAPCTAAPGEEIGTRIDRYKLLEKIGEGGCGIVYLAEQEQPVRRRVALKVIKLGMDTTAVIARFEAERQALALMDHPNIARVFDAGATSTGRPYFVMELVEGVRITDYCDQQHFSTAERLALFTRVCQAIQHAHQKGVIHRDIKPSNILVALHDGEPVPKVIDFGIAKATHGRLTDRTLFTAFEQFVGTPAYMSPEQADLSGIDVDTRSDIYSLGVLLYELLAGTPPFDPQTLRQAGLDEIRRIIRDVEPPRPSTRLSTLTDADRATIAQRRDIAPAQLSDLLRGDLDWIVMRCLEKDRARRYDTPGALAADIARHLENEPVLARPPSTRDQIRKLVARHKLAFASATALGAMLIAGLAVSTWQFFREKAALARAVAAEQVQSRLRAEAEAALTRAQAAEQTQARLAAQNEIARQNEARERVAADTARANEARMRAAAEEGETRAQTEAVRSAQVARLMTEMLKNVGPHVALGRDTKLLRDILDDTARRLGTDLAGQPDVELELRETLGSAYSDLGDHVNVVAMRRRALELRRELWGDEHLTVALALTDLGRALLASGKAAEAEAAFRMALALQEKLGDGRVKITMGFLASALERLSRHTEAEALHRTILAWDKEQWGEGSPNLAGQTMNLGSLLSRQGRKAEAEILLREALAAQRARPNNDLGVASVLNNLGTTLSDLGRLDEAELALREALALRKKRLGGEHPDLGGAISNLAGVLRRQEKFDEAEALYREALALQRKFFGPDHPQPAGTGVNLGHLLQTRRRWDEAHTLFNEALAVHRRLQYLPGVSSSLLFLAHLEEARGRSAEAERHFRAALELLRQTPNELQERTSTVLLGLARVLRAQQRETEAALLDDEGTALRAQIATATAPNIPPRPAAAIAATNLASNTTPGIARRPGVDTIRIVSLSPTQAVAGTPTTFMVRVRYRLASRPVGRINLSFNTLAPKRYPIAESRVVDAGDSEIEFTATVAPVHRADGTKFSVIASLAAEPRVSGSSNLASDSRSIEVP